MLDVLWLVAVVVAVFLLAYIGIEAAANIYKFVRVRNAEASVAEAQARMAWLEVREKDELINRYILDNNLIQPSQTGHLPVARQLLVDGTLAQAQLGLISQDIATRMPMQPVPTTVHYAPHYARVDAPTKVDLDGDGQLPAIIKPQDMWSLYTAGALPDNGFLMGYNLDNGEPVIADWKQLYSALVGGQSGSGKSTLIRSMLTQSAIQGGRFVVLDKHFNAGDDSLGASIMPLRGRFMADIAATEKQMVDAIKFMRHIGGQRLQGIDKDKTPVVLVVDETTALLSRSDIAGELKALLGEIAQETRKVGVYAFCIGQNFHGDIMDTKVRNSFVSMISCRARQDVARTMTGSGEFGKLVGTIQTGQCVWMNTNGEMVRLAVPNTTLQHVGLIARELDGQAQVVDTTSDALPTHFRRTSNALPGSDFSENGSETEVAGKRSGSETEVNTTPLFDAVKVRLVKDMLANCASQTAIIQNVWGVKGGRGYKSAAEELHQILAYLAKGNQP